MNWTTEKPTAPGWYWWRFGEGSKPIMTDVELHGDALFYSTRTLNDRGKPYGEWCGPLHPPSTGDTK